MESLIDFYNNLLSIQIAVFGIISAVVLVFIQLVYSTYSYKHIGHILSNKWLVLFFVFSTVDVLITSAGTYFLSLNNHDFFPTLYLATNNIIVSPLYALLCLVLIFVSISFFVILIIKNIEYLQPHRAVFLLSKSIKHKDISNFLWKKYGLEAPFNLKIRIVSYILDDKKNPNESEKSHKARIKREEKKSDEELKRIEKVIEKINKQVSDSDDPLLSIRDMMIRFVRKSDLSSLQEAASLLVSITKNYYEALPKKNDEWTPESALPLNYTKHIIESLKTIFEIAKNEKLESAERIIMEATYEVALVLFENKEFNALDKVEEFWQEIADASIGKSSLLFQDIIGYYDKLGTKLLTLLENKPPKTNSKDEYERIIENLFRYIGWLGERMLIKIPMEESPMFRNYEYNTEYDTYYNCLLSFGDFYERKRPDLYPLIYFDALYVIAKRLIDIYKKDKTSDLGNNIFSIAWEFSSFSESAIRANNSRGASLGASRIKEVYDELKKAGLDSEAKDVIRLLVRIGVLAAGHKEEKIDFFMGKSLAEWVINELAESYEDVSSEVHECFIKFDYGDHDSKWSFITQLGMRMGTNFGLMFDPANGQIYADDDPRRR